MCFQSRNPLSPQENQTLEGLTRTLQTSKRDAIRIAIYELGKTYLKQRIFSNMQKKNQKKRSHIQKS